MRIIAILAYILLLAAALAAPWLMNAAFERFGIYDILPAPPHTEQD